jgi:hypothetical protein
VNPPSIEAHKNTAEEGTTSSDIQIGFFRKGESEPIQTVILPVPKGFPVEFIETLSNFYCEGFREALWVTQHPQHRIRMPRGRPSNQVLKNLGKEAARLHETKGMSFGKIATRFCEKKSAEPSHLCNKNCADRMRQRALPYLKPRSPVAQEK